MRALLLAAGIGSRLRPVTDTVPKCMVPIRGRPLIDYWFDLLFTDDSVERALINTHHLAEVVVRHVAQSRWRSRIDLVHEPVLLGTAGTVKANRVYFGAESFLVAHADNLTELDAAVFAAAHAGRPAHCAMTMLSFQTDDPRSCGILELDGQGVVQALHEKVAGPPGFLANAAVYMLTPEVADCVAGLPGPFIDFSTEVLPRFIGRIFAVPATGYHRDIGNLESLARAERDFAARG